METTKIRWKFEGLASTFETDQDKLESTVNKLRQRNYLAYNHPVQILSNGNNTTTESVANDIPVSDSPSNTKKRKSVSKPVESAGPVEETPIVRNVSNDVDHTNTESDLL